MNPSSQTNKQASGPRFSLSLAIALLVFVLPAAVVLYTGRRDYADMHIMFDTGMYLLPGVLAMLFWDMGIRIESPFPKCLAVSFGITAVLAFVHALVILLTGWGQRLVAEGEVPPHVELVLNKPPKLRAA